MKKLIKKTIAINILIAAALSLARPASASDFDLSSLSAGGLRGTEFKAAPVPRPRAPKADPDELVGIDLSIRVPFKAIKKAVVMMAASDKRLSIIDPAAPVLERSGESLKVVNIRLDLNGIIIEPVVTLKPYFEGKDKLAMLIQRVQMHASMSPSASRKSKSAAVSAPAAANTEPEFNKEDMMADIMGVLTGGIMDAFNASLIENHSPLKASDIVVFKYDKAAWTLHAVVSTAALKRYLPEGVVGDVHLTGLSLSDNAIGIKFGTEE
ncbi:MAG: hypothetical protein NTX59_01790 [Elusimicrobia bacterium]|nr:hypothetical protein [Elusimicrobiota bacterium]